MRRAASTPTDPWAALDALCKREAEPTGPEWFTVKQFAERYDMTESPARVKIASLVKDGTLVSWTGMAGKPRRATTKYSLAKQAAHY
jgi:hypothetical protein